MDVDIEHILDRLDRYGKGELTEEQVIKTLTLDEKMFLILHHGFLETDEEALDVMGYLDKVGAFFLVVEVKECLCREAESVLEEIGVAMPDAIGDFLKQLVETKQLPIVVKN